MRPGGRRAVELVLRTGRRSTVLGLVRIIQTVVISIADPGLRNATLIFAGEIPSIWTRRKWRFRVGVGSASFTVGRKGFSVRTSAPSDDADARRVRRDGEAELLTPAVVGMTGVTVNNFLGFLKMEKKQICTVL